MYEVQCEGSNFGWIHKLRDDCVDHSRITSNDIRAVLQFYGIEACRFAIIRELNRVFSVYGITVDCRHLTLIADAMTHSGGCNNKIELCCTRSFFRVFPVVQSSRYRASLVTISSDVL